ncbi:MAG: hypothetical protein OXG58_04435 [Gemmatimonadetes bacterium]|nr:hypothetical protein [Gemmatimonadota bacterium]MCY3943173.1 hypothetical protein [Gemmatimonadota bacterium]
MGIVPVRIVTVFTGQVVEYPSDEGVLEPESLGNGTVLRGQASLGVPGVRPEVCAPRVADAHLITQLDLRGRRPFQGLAHWSRWNIIIFLDTGSREQLAKDLTTDS